MEPCGQGQKIKAEEGQGKRDYVAMGRSSFVLGEDLQCGYFGITNVLVFTMLYNEAQWLKLIISEDEFIQSSSGLSLGPEEGKEMLFKVLPGKDFSDIRVLPLPNNPRIVAKP